MIEFPTREDPMVQKLLARKREGLHPDYELATSSAALAERFTVERTERASGRARASSTSPSPKRA